MKKIFLFLLLISSTALAGPATNYYPESDYFISCVDNVNDLWADHSRFKSMSLRQGTGPANGTTSLCNNEDPNCVKIYAHVVYAFLDSETNGEILSTSCGEWRFPGEGLNSALRVLLTNSTFKDTITCGSVIDYNKKLVTESIPIVGTEFELNYSSEFNSHSSVNKIVAADLSNENKMVAGNLVKLYAGNVEVFSKTTLEFLKIFDFKYIWDGLTGIQSSSAFVDIINIRIIISKNIRHQNEETSMGGCIFTSLIPLVYSCPSPGMPFWVNIVVSDTSTKIVVYKPEAYGLSGWTLSGHHFFNSGEKVLFRGDGSRVDYKNFKTINHPTYGNVDLVIEKNSGQELYIFGQDGKHLETRHATMNFSIFKFQYDGNRLVSITDRNSKQTQFLYDANQNLSKIIAPYMQETSLANVDGKISRVTTPAGHFYEMIYDEKYQLTNFKAINGVETTFSYNQDGEVTQEIKNNGLLQAFTDRVDNWFKEYILFANFGAVKKVQMKYRYAGSETVITDGEDRTVQTVFNYSKSYQQRTVAGGASYTKGFGQSAMWGDDYMPTNSEYSEINESGQSISNTKTTTETRLYTDNLNPLSLTKVTVQSATNGRSNTNEIDVALRKITTTEPDSKVTNIFYNGRGQIGRIKPQDQSATFFTYNSNGQLSLLQKGTQTETFAYNNAGLLASKTNSKGQTTYFSYDANSNLIEKTLPNLDKIKFERSPSGEITKITAPNNQIHNFQLSLGDYLQNYLSPDNTQTSFFYDQDKRLIKTVKPSQKEILYNYKTNSAELASITTPAGNILLNNLDAQGRLKDITSADGIRTTIQWVANQVQQQTWYDSDGSVIGTLSNNFESNELRVKEIYLNDQNIARYQYNLPGQIAKVTVRGNEFLYDHQFDANSTGTYIYNNAFIFEYLKQDTESGNVPVQVVGGNATEDPNNQIFFTMKRAYDNFGVASGYSILTRNYNTGVFNSYYEFSPQYDANDRLIQVQKIRRNFIDNVAVDTTDFYNNYNYPAGSNNNMKEFNHTSNVSGVSNKRTIATHSTDDKLLTLRGSIHRDYTYTADGDLESMTNCYGKIEYEYDVFSNLKKVILANGTVIEYKVDGMNRRVKKLVNGTVKEYYIWYDQIHLAAVLDQNKVAKLTYIYSSESNSPSYLVKGDTTYRIIHDPGLGSVRYIVNTGTTQIAQDIEYDEYGNVMKNTNPDFQPITYAGGLYDSDTKLIRFGARDYDPTIGRWTTKDPIGFAGGDTNLYAYVGGNPMSYNDPFGLMTEAQCKKLLEKIENLKRDVAKRQCDLKDNPLNLPYNPPYDGAPPRMSQRGHEDLLQDRKDNLERSRNLYNSSCGGKGGGGSPVFDPSKVPIPIPIPIPPNFLPVLL